MNFVAPCQKIIAAFLSAVLFFTSVIPAQAVIPAPVGTIIHIQDVHQNADAQRSIQKEIQRLINSGQVDLVALEAAFKPLSLDPIRRFPDKAVTKSVANYLLRENKISGAVYAGFMAAPGSVPFVGVDDEELYEANVEAYRASRNFQFSVFNQFSIVRDQLTAKKRRVFNETLLAFDDVVERYRKGDVGLGDYVRTLYAVRGTWNVLIFLEAFELEQKLDVKKVEAEREVLVRRLLSRLSNFDVQRLVNKSAAFKQGTLSHAHFYSFLRKLSESNDISLSQFPHMESYFQYVSLTEKINPEQLFKEIQELEKKRYEELAGTEEEKKLVKESRTLYLKEKLANFALTPEEWNEYKTTVPSRLRAFETFYEAAEKRDVAMAKNLQAAMKKYKAKNVILVTGGFHAKGIQEALKQPVTSFIPKISKVETENGSKYLSVFAQEKTPLDQIFEGKKLFLSQKVMPSNEGILGLFSLRVKQASVRIGSWVWHALFDTDKEFKRVWVVRSVATAGFLSAALIVLLKNPLMGMMVGAVVVSRHFGKDPEVEAVLENKARLMELQDWMSRYQDLPDEQRAGIHAFLKLAPSEVAKRDILRTLNLRGNQKAFEVLKTHTWFSEIESMIRKEYDSPLPNQEDMYKEWTDGYYFRIKQIIEGYEEKRGILPFRSYVAYALSNGSLVRPDQFGKRLKEVLRDTKGARVKLPVEPHADPVAMALLQLAAQFTAVIDKSAQTFNPAIGLGPHMGVIERLAKEALGGNGNGDPLKPLAHLVQSSKGNPEVETLRQEQGWFYDFDTALRAELGLASFNADEAPAETESKQSKVLRGLAEVRAAAPAKNLAAEGAEKSPKVKPSESAPEEKPKSKPKKKNGPRILTIYDLFDFYDDRFGSPNRVKRLLEALKQGLDDFRQFKKEGDLFWVKRYLAKEPENFAFLLDLTDLIDELSADYRLDPDVEAIRTHFDESILFLGRKYRKNSLVQKMLRILDANVETKPSVIHEIRSDRGYLRSLAEKFALIRGDGYEVTALLEAVHWAFLEFENRNQPLPGKGEITVDEIWDHLLSEETKYLLDELRENEDTVEFEPGFHSIAEVTRRLMLNKKRPVSDEVTSLIENHLNHPLIHHFQDAVPEQSPVVGGVSRMVRDVTSPGMPLDEYAVKRAWWVENSIGLFVGYVAGIGIYVTTQNLARSFTFGFYFSLGTLIFIHLFEFLYPFFNRQAEEASVDVVMKRLVVALFVSLVSFVPYRLIENAAAGVPVALVLGYLVHLGANRFLGDLHDGDEEKVLSVLQAHFEGIVRFLGYEEDINVTIETYEDLAQAHNNLLEEIWMDAENGHARFPRLKEEKSSIYYAALGHFARSIEAAAQAAGHAPTAGSILSSSVSALFDVPNISYSRRKDIYEVLDVLSNDTEAKKFAAYRRYMDVVYKLRDAGIREFDDLEEISPFDVHRLTDGVTIPDLARMILDHRSTIERNLFKKKPKVREENGSLPPIVLNRVAVQVLDFIAGRRTMLGLNTVYETDVIPNMNLTVALDVDGQEAEMAAYVEDLLKLVPHESQHLTLLISDNAAFMEKVQSHRVRFEARVGGFIRPNNHLAVERVEQVLKQRQELVSGSWFAVQEGIVIPDGAIRPDSLLHQMKVGYLNALMRFVPWPKQSILERVKTQLLNLLYA